MYKHITRKSFLSICLATLLAACIKRRDYSVVNQDAERLYPPMGRLEIINELKFHSYQTGIGPEKVIFIHGANINLRDWVFANSSIEPNSYEAIYVDRPGFGYSERDTSSWTARRQAEQIREFARINEIKQPILVAHSWGALVALEWILAHPGEIKGFVSVSGVNNSFGGIAEWMSREGLFDLPVELYSQHLAKNASTGSIERFAKRVFSPQIVPKDYLESVGVDLSRRRKTIMANNEDLKQTAKTVADLEKRYAEIEIPVEIIHGARDWLLKPNSHGKEFSKKICNSNLSLLDGVGHMAHHADPDSVHNAIKRIL